MKQTRMKCKAPFNAGPVGECRKDDGKCLMRWPIYKEVDIAAAGKASAGDHHDKKVLRITCSVRIQKPNTDGVFPLLLCESHGAIIWNDRATIAESNEQRQQRRSAMINRNNV